MGKANVTEDFKRDAVLQITERGYPIAEVAARLGTSQATYFNWKKKYEGLTPPEMRRLKQIEDENVKLRKLVADLSLDREMLQDIVRREI